MIGYVRLVARVSQYEAHKLLVLMAVHSAVARHGRPPSVRDLAALTGVGVATVHSYLSKLAEEELIEWRAKSHRSLRLTESGLLVAQAAAQP